MPARDRYLFDGRIGIDGLVGGDAHARAVDGNLDAEQPAEIRRVDVQMIVRDRCEHQLQRLGAVLAHDVRPRREGECGSVDDDDAVGTLGVVGDVQVVERRFERDHQLQSVANRFNARRASAVDDERELEARSREFGSATEDGRYGEREGGKRRERATVW